MMLTLINRYALKHTSKMLNFSLANYSFLTKVFNYHEKIYKSVVLIVF
jgi:hypothetical protein